MIADVRSQHLTFLAQNWQLSERLTCLTKAFSLVNISWSNKVSLPLIILIDLRAITGFKAPLKARKLQTLVRISSAENSDEGDLLLKLRTVSKLPAASTKIHGGWFEYHLPGGLQRLHATRCWEQYYGSWFWPWLLEVLSWLVPCYRASDPSRPKQGKFSFRDTAYFDRGVVDCHQFSRMHRILPAQTASVDKALLRDQSRSCRHLDCRHSNTAFCRCPVNNWQYRLVSLSDRVGHRMRHCVPSLSCFYQSWAIRRCKILAPLSLNSHPS